MENAKDQYNNRLKERKTNIAKIRHELKDIQARIDKNKTEIDKNKTEIGIENQEMKNILNKITIQDIKTNKQIKKLVIQAEEIFIKY